MPFISKVGSLAGNRYHTVINSNANIVLTNGLTDMSTTGMTLRTSISGVDDGFVYLPYSMDFNFYGTTYNSDGSTNTSNAVYWNTNNVLGFGVGTNTITWAANTGKGFLTGNYDRRTNTCYSSYNSSGGISILKIVTSFQNVYSDGVPNAGKYQIRLIRDTNSSKQYYEVRSNSGVSIGGTWSVTNGSTFNPNVYITNISSGTSYVLVNNNLNGDSWTYVANSYVNI